MYSENVKGSDIIALYKSVLELQYSLKFRLWITYSIIYYLQNLLWKRQIYYLFEWFSHQLLHFSGKLPDIYLHSHMARPINYWWSFLNFSLQGQVCCNNARASIDEIFGCGFQKKIWYNLSNLFIIVRHHEWDTLTGS